MGLVLQLLQGKDVKDLSREAGRPVKQLTAWKRRFLEGGKAGLSGADPAELERLRVQSRDLSILNENLEEEKRQLVRRLGVLERRRSTSVHPLCSEQYSQAFEEEGVYPHYVADWGAHVLVREGRGTLRVRHATGVQPYAPLDPHSTLRRGLDALKSADITSITLVTDPMWCPELEVLQHAFDTCRPFKENYLIDRQAGSLSIRKRQRNIINNARRVGDARVVSLTDHLDRWWDLYEQHVRNRKIAQAFSRSYFERLAPLDGLTTIAVFVAHDIVTMTLWIHFDDILYYLDGASDEKGLEISASYAAFAYAIDHFQQCDYVVFGGAADFRDTRDDGLAVFKRGFANASAQSYLCSSILSRP